MPIKLNASFNNAAPVVKKKIIDMIIEYRTHLRPMSNMDLLRRFGSTRPGIEETKSSYVSVSEILHFLADNPTADTIHIYFAAHDTSTLLDLGYEMQGQITTILVAAKATFDAAGNVVSLQDLLNDNAADGPVNSVSMNFVFGGMGDDQYPLCPPHCPGGSSL